MEDCATQAWRCNAGYDNQEDSTQCQATIAGHYSFAGSNIRTACTKPNDSSWTTTTGLASVEDCATQAWRCKAGYDNQEDSTQCQVTIAGHYSSAGSNIRTACTKPDDSSWTTTTGLTSVEDCATQAWRCKAGYDNQEDSTQCQATIAGHYSSAGSNIRTACTKLNNSSWTTTTGLTSVEDCATQAWRCNAGYDYWILEHACKVTSAGYYSLAGSNARIACTKPDDSSWTTTTGLTSVEDCATQAWRCNAGYDNQEDSAQCQATIAKHYSLAESNERVACPTKPDDSSWTSMKGLTSEADCATQAWRCKAGYDNQEDSTQCQATITGHYSPTGSNDRIQCPTPDNSSPVTITGLTSVNECFTCEAGFDNSQNANLCEATAIGYYSPASSNDRTVCTGNPDDSSWTVTGLISQDGLCRSGLDL